MKMIRNRLIALFLCMLMLCGAVPFGALTACAEDEPAEPEIPEIEIVDYMLCLLYFVFLGGYATIKYSVCYEDNSREYRRDVIPWR